MDLKRYNVGIVGAPDSGVKLFVQLLFDPVKPPPTDRGTSKQLVYQRVTPYKEVDVKVYFGYHPSGDISERAVDYDLLVVCYNSSDLTTKGYKVEGVPDDCPLLQLDMLPVVTSNDRESMEDRLKVIFLSLGIRR